MQKLETTESKLVWYYFQVTYEVFFYFYFLYCGFTYIIILLY